MDFIKEIESSVLCGLIDDNDKWTGVSMILSAVDFDRAVHQRIFEAISISADAGQPFKPATILERLKTDDRDYIGKLLKKYNAEHLISRALIVRRESFKRQKKALPLDSQPELFSINITYEKNGKKRLLQPADIAGTLSPILSKLLSYDRKKMLWSRYYEDGYWCPIMRIEVAKFIDELIKFNSKSCVCGGTYNIIRIKKILAILEGDFKAAAAKKWKKAEIRGDGPYAVVASCNDRTIVTLYRKSLAKKYKKYIDEGGCCDNCKSYDHPILNLGRL